ncbi:MAG: EAL domain-containing protein [Myxococcota bacterium]|nr:EAL domain-containing protein [Myxococcota bacterium]
MSAVETARVLIAAADPALRRQARQVLARGGFAAEEVEPGAPLRASIEASPPALILVDARIGEGARTAPLSPAAPGVPTIALVPASDPAATERALRAGAADVVALPLLPAVLLHRVRIALTLSGRGHALQRAEQRVQQLSSRDGVTGLPNRPAFLEGLERFLRERRPETQRAALLLIDLDNFKRVNDTFTHAAGDVLLRGVAERLARCLRRVDEETVAGAGDVLSRIGGDEFAVLLARITANDDAARVARRVIDAMREPLVAADVDMVVGASIGIAVCPNDGEEAATLLRKADTALYHAKEEGRNDFRFYTESIDRASIRKYALERKLCRAFENHELRVYYQPQVEVATGRLTGVEALLRWEDAELGAVSPAEFVPLAEEAGLITPIGDWVLRRACAQACDWRSAGLPPFRIAVNISPHHFRDASLVDTVRRTLFETGLPPACLELEITEGALMHSREAAAAQLGELKRIGVSVALDDFGTGYSSLSYLKGLPVDAVKIDRSFVRCVTLDPEDAAIAEAIISMARALQLRVVAEGVENERQRDFLGGRACSEMQGYLIGPPVSAEAITELFRVDLGRNDAAKTP